MTGTGTGTQTQTWTTGVTTIALLVLRTGELKSLMNGQTVGRTNEGKIICPINFIRNWEHNQVIYSSLPIYSSSFKAPASIVFEIFCSQGKHAQIYKGPLLMKYFSEFTKKLIRSSTHHYQSIHQVSSL